MAPKSSKSNSVKSVEVKSEVKPVEVKSEVKPVEVNPVEVKPVVSTSRTKITSAKKSSLTSKKNESIDQPIVESVQPVVESVQPIVESVQPVVESVQPVVESVVESKQKKVTKKTKSISVPEQSVEKPVEQPVEKPVEKPVEQPVEKPVEQPVEDVKVTKKMSKPKSKISKLSNKKTKLNDKKIKKNISKKQSNKIVSEQKVDNEDGVVDKKKRFFEWTFNNHQAGRIAARKPMQAAKKAYRSIVVYIKNQQPNFDFSNEIEFSLRECTRRSNNNIYNYKGSDHLIRDLLTPTQIAKYEHNEKMRSVDEKFKSKPILLKDENTGEIIGLSLFKRETKKMEDGTIAFVGYKAVHYKRKPIIKKIPKVVKPLIVA